MSKCIYVLEDNDDIRELLTYLLLEENYTVLAYPTVSEFKNKLNYKNPDLVVLDVMLADGNGIDVCNEIKQNSTTKSIPILMMSAHLDSYAIKKSCQAEAFISKPFDIYDLIQKVDYFLH